MPGPRYDWVSSESLVRRLLFSSVSSIRFRLSYREHRFVSRSIFVLERSSTMKLLQINYQLDSAVSEFMGKSIPVANIVATVPGLRWKIWLKNETADEGGGIYLFEDTEALKSFIEGPIIARLRSHPAVVNVSVKEFDVPEELSTITRAPV